MRAGLITDPVGMSTTAVLQGDEWVIDTHGVPVARIYDGPDEVHRQLSGCPSRS